jgi:hypothetical protein
MFNRFTANCCQELVLLDIAPTEAVPDEESNSDSETSSQFQQLCLVFANLQNKHIGNVGVDVRVTSVHAI